MAEWTEQGVEAHGHLDGALAPGFPAVQACLSNALQWKRMCTHLFRLSIHLYSPFCLLSRSWPTLKRDLLLGFQERQDFQNLLVPREHPHPSPPVLFVVSQRLGTPGNQVWMMSLSPSPTWYALASGLVQFFLSHLCSAKLRGKASICQFGSTGCCFPTLQKGELL